MILKNRLLMMYQVNRWGQIKMTEHSCNHEVDLALLQQNTKEIQTDIKTILESITGNGSPGLKTEVALVKQAINRLWAFLGGGVLVIVGCLGIYFGVK